MQENEVTFGQFPTVTELRSPEDGPCDTFWEQLFSRIWHVFTKTAVLCRKRHLKQKGSVEHSDNSSWLQSFSALKEAGFGRF